MTEFFRFVVEVCTYLFPFRSVEHWERGVYYWLGKAYRVVGPGRWPCVPYFMDVRAVSVVPDPVIAGWQDVTLADGATVGYNASVIMVVMDPDQALNAIHDYEKAVLEILQRNVGMKLQAETADKLTAEKRGRFLAGILTTINTETQKFGVQVSSLAFTSFVMNVPTMRLLTGHEALAA